jgi:uncharacterized protein (DUF305 family)
VNAARHVPLVLMLLAAAGCRTVPAATKVPASPSPPDSPAPLVQPGAPGQPTHAIDVAHATDLSRVSFTLADVQFMQGMIGHHAQAVEMVELLKTRTRRDDMKMLGLRIEVSQVDEIRMMQHWLEARGQAVPDEHAHHQHDAAPMPGMLTPEAMARLAAASGPSFDRLFLEGMMSHHEGALVMVRDLFASPGAGQDTEIFAFASDVEADQKMEIDRMGAMLKELPQ